MPHAPKDPYEYVDWLLAHMQNNLSMSLKRTYIWEFSFQTPGLPAMDSLSRALRKSKYPVQEITDVQEISEGPGGKQVTKKGKPMVSAFYKGKCDAAALKERIEGLIAIAKNHKCKYVSLNSMDEEEFEMMYGPPKAMKIGESIWRLRNLTDLGHEEGEEIGYSFCLTCEDKKTVMAALRKAKIGGVSSAPKDANWDITVTTPGINDEAALTQAFNGMKKTAKVAGAKLIGMIF